MTNEIVQIRPCMDLEDGQVTQCPLAEADYFGVYHGGPGNLMWAADFGSYTDARNWAEEVAENHECPLSDLVELERMP